MTNDEQYEVVIGLEVHAQLLTRTKLFCADTTNFGAEANTQVSSVSLAHPGTLPKLNKEAIALAIRLGLATESQIVERNYFARKNYFYPDLPKGYQISQHTTPICKGGYVEIIVGNAKRKVKLNRIHIEEDAGKMVHDGGQDFTRLDFNRAGMPLLEIVTEPDMHSAEEAAAYVTTLRKLVRRLGVCDGNMEEGSLRCDVNISVRLQGDLTLGTKVEIKNLNSIRYIKKAIEFEKALLIEKHKKSEVILQQTKGLDDTTFHTYVIRTKEDEDDYRYFPEPDLPPFIVTREQIEVIRQTMPPLQTEVKEKLIHNFTLPEYDATQLSEDPELTDYFMELTQYTMNHKAAANWCLGPIKNHLINQDTSITEIQLPATAVALLIQFIDKGAISFGMAAQKIFPQLINHPLIDLERYITDNNLGLQSANETDTHIEAALIKFAQKIPEYKKGKKGLVSLFVGEVMKLSKGKANAEEVTKKMIEKLNN